MIDKLSERKERESVIVRGEKPPDTLVPENELFTKAHIKVKKHGD